MADSKRKSDHKFGQDALGEVADIADIFQDTMAETESILQDAQIRSYLLGTTQAEEIEYGILNGTYDLNKITVVEDELIEDFVAGQLNIQEWALFKNRFLTNTERRQKIRLCAMLHNKPQILQILEIFERGKEKPQIPSEVLLKDPVSRGAGMHFSTQQPQKKDNDPDRAKPFYSGVRQNVLIWAGVITVLVLFFLYLLFVQPR